MGVWIETSPSSPTIIFAKSHPAWVCGLKLWYIIVCTLTNAVTPCVGVWIETFNCSEKTPRRCCHTLRGCVDWNYLLVHYALFYLCHTLRGCVDWNIRYVLLYCNVLCHTLRGCVDWNFQYGVECITDIGVTPCVGVWIETFRQILAYPTMLSHPAWVCGLKLLATPQMVLLHQSHPAWVCGLKRTFGLVLHSR